MRSVLLLLLSSWYSAQTTTQFVDDLEPQLRTNRDQYLSGPHTAVRQRTALDYFDAQWAWLHSSQACGSKMLGKAGKACLEDRHRDGQWSWERWYRDPIETAPGK
jgi:hypothetical protein